MQGVRWDLEGPESHCEGALQEYDQWLLWEHRSTTRGREDFFLEGRCLAQALKGDLFSYALTCPAPLHLLVLLSASGLFHLRELFSPLPIQASPSRSVSCHFSGPHPYDIVSSQSIPTLMFAHRSLALTSSCIYMAHTSAPACPR